MEGIWVHPVANSSFLLSSPRKIKLAAKVFQGTLVIRGKKNNEYDINAQRVALIKKLPINSRVGIFACIMAIKVAQLNFHSCYNIISADWGLL